MAPIHMTAIIAPTAGKEERLTQVLLQHAEYVRSNEPGTLHYEVKRGVEREMGATTIVVWEVYQDEAAQMAHFNNETFSALIKTLGGEALTAGAPSVYVTSSQGGVTNWKA